jgi:hypothetical protein
VIADRRKRPASADPLDIAVELAGVISRSDDELDLVEAAQVRQKFRSAVPRRLPELAGALLGAFIILKVLLVGEGVPATALGIVAAAGPIPVLTGVVVQALPLLAGGLCWIVSLASTNDRYRPFRTVVWLLYVLLVGAVFSQMLAWYTTIVFLVAALFLAPYGVRKRTGISWIYGRIARWSARRSVRILRAGGLSDINEPSGNALGAEVSPSTDVLEAWAEGLAKEAPSDSILRKYWKAVFANWRFAQAAASDEERAVFIDKIASTKLNYDRRVREIESALQQSNGGWSLTSLALVLTAASALPALLSDRPWVPASSITLAHSSRFTGYVVQRDQDWTTVLSANGHMIRQIKTADIVSMQICSLPEDKSSPTLWRAFAKRPPSYPPC